MSRRYIGQPPVLNSVLHKQPVKLEQIFSSPGPDQDPVYNSSARDFENWFELLAHVPSNITQVLF